MPDRRWAPRLGLRAAVAVLATLGAVAAVVPAAVGQRSAGASGGGTVWLCRPGARPDPCVASLATTALSASGTERVEGARLSTSARVDCFYVYPTVSRETSAIADLSIQPAETAVAFDQASRFSQVCRVFAPMYRQVTLLGIVGAVPVSAADHAQDYSSLRSAFEEYLAHDNHGRGIVFIGHSQGALALIELLQQLVDPNPALRKRLVSAILLGGDFTVPVGRRVGGTFQHIPACATATETGCVVAYSTFVDPPPSDSLFGRTNNPALETLCVNPAALGGGPAPLAAYFPSASGKALGFLTPEPTVATPWISVPGLYTGQCVHLDGASYLQVTPRAGDPRPIVSEVLGATWGTHLDDVNLALGNLVSLVGVQIRAYERR